MKSVEWEKLRGGTGKDIFRDKYISAGHANIVAIHPSKVAIHPNSKVAIHPPMNSHLRISGPSRQRGASPPTRFISFANRSVKLSLHDAACRGRSAC